MSASVLKIIWLVLLFWTSSPFTLQRIPKLCGSRQKEKVSNGVESTQPQAPGETFACGGGVPSDQHRSEVQG